MADRAFSTLVTRIQPNVPQCPYPTIVNYVRDAAIKACERSLAWRYQIPLYNLTPAVHEYTFNVAANQEVHAIFAALVNNEPLDLLTLDQAIGLFPDWADLFSGEDASVVWSETPGGNTYNSGVYDDTLFDAGSLFVLPDAIVADAAAPSAIVMLTPQKYIVLPLPDAATDYETRMFVALKPTRSATGMDDEIFNELEDIIMHKTLEDLLLLPNVPWSNPQLASVHAQKYTYQSGERKIRANLGHVRGSMSVRIPFWA